MFIAATQLIRELRSLPRAYWVLCAGTFVNRFGTFVYPFLTLYLSRRGLGPGSIGLVLAGYGAGGLAATLAGGWFADRFGRRNAIVCGTFAQAACTLSLAASGDPLILAVLTALAGFAGGFYYPAANALVADLIPAEERLTAYAGLRQAANAGFAFGVAVGGFLMSAGTFWLFAGDALTTAAYGVLALAALPHGLRQNRREARWSEAWAKIRGDRAFRALFVAQLAVAFVFSQFASTYALEVTRRDLRLEVAGAELSPTQVYGLLIGLNGLLILALELPLTRLTRTWQVRRVMAAGYACIGAGFAVNILHGGTGLLAVGMGIFTLGEMLAMPMLSAWISHLAPENMRGRYMGAVAMAWTAGNILGPNIGLRVLVVSPAALWGSCAALGLGAAATILVLGREKPQASPWIAKRKPELAVR